MKINRRRKTGAFGAILCAACILPAGASVDNSAKPGGVYGLKPGIYVVSSTSCENASPAQARRYDGRSIGTATTRSCSVLIRGRKQQTFTVDQSCHFTRGGADKRLVQRQRVRVYDALTFTQTVGGYGKTYRYCPAYQLSNSLIKVFR